MPRGRVGLSRQQRLTNAGQFKAVFDKRQRVHGRCFSFHVTVNGLDTCRIGLAVSRKVSKSAVQRNRIKRQIRESFRCFSVNSSSRSGAHDGVTLIRGIDFVVVAKAAAANTQNKDLRQELDQQWFKASKKCEAS